MKAKKSFGQHFLTQPAIAQGIADALTGYENYDKIVEIGPGKGMLTQFLFTKPYRLKVVEADEDMVNYIAENFSDSKIEEVVANDFLKVDLDQIWNGDSFGLIGNYPYNISSQIVFKMVENRHLIPEMVGMFQKEMADRIIAKHGNKDYGVISVLTQIYYEGKMMFNVGPGNFNPPPKVQSAVIRLRRRSIPLWEGDENWLRIVVKSAFNQRRKMLRNTIKPLVVDNYDLSDNFYNLRPEQLSVQQFIDMTNTLAPFRK